jgi:hypothetical protein
MLRTRNQNGRTRTPAADSGVLPVAAAETPALPESKVAEILGSCNVTVMSGSSSREFPVARQMVGDVRRLLRAVLNVADDAIALINGAEAGEDAVLAANDRLEFVRRAGMKGSRC